MKQSPPPAPLTAEEFAAISGVSPPVLAALEIYVGLLLKWQKRINLVGGGALDDVWRRHILDSAQLHPLLPAGATVLDMGSGAGFPGLVLAIMGGCTVHLVESDSRKCAFLLEVIGHTKISNARLHNGRLQSLAPFAAQVITSRALASLDKLLDLAAPFSTAETTCLFLKGQKAQQELTQTLKNRTMKNRTMEVSMIDSQTSPSGTILKIRNVRRNP